MEVEYSYPKLKENWDFWIVTMNIERDLGKKPEYLSGSTDLVVVVFKDPLSDDEKRKLDSIMGDLNVGLYPSSSEGYTVLKIKDIWDYRGLVEKATGKRVKWLRFPPPLPDGSHIMELWVEGTLSPAERRKCREAYAELISE